MTLILAVLPPLLIAYYVYQKDKYDKEPKSLIIKSFLFGCLGIIPAIFLELFAEGMFTNLILYVFIGIALVEEGVKYFFLKKYLFNNKEFNEPMDGIVYAVMISLGFATVENLFYVFNYAGDQETRVAIIRMFSAIPLHAACGVIMGYFVGQAKFNIKSNNYLFKGLFSAVIIHGLYNYFIFLGDTSSLSFVVLFIAILFSRKAINIHQEDSKIRNL